MSVREGVAALIQGIESGKVLETFDRWYADDVVMSENGVTETRGKAANRAREEAFVASVQAWHAVKTGLVLVDGDHAAIEQSLDFTPKGGQRMTQRQVSLQTWRNGKIIREVFYHA